VSRKDYAVVVGINDYPFFRGLDGACQDAQSVANWLQRAGVDPADCHTMISTPAPPQPLQERIDDAFVRILDAVDDIGGRRLYFYFSGHGMTAANEATSVALCLARWSDRFRHMALDSREYHNELVQGGRFEELVIWLDCCRSRQFNVGGLRPSFGMLGRGPCATRTFFAYATEHLDTAYEAATGDTVGKRGIFTGVLLAGLQGSAADGSRVTAASLKRYLEAETPRAAQAAGYAQRADVSNGLPDSATFGDAAPSPTGELKVHFAADLPEVVVESAQGLGVVRKDPARAAVPWELTVPQGIYIVRDPSSSREALVRVKVGGLVDVVF
jgi:uncharacterized caspase-like protein